ncbi:MAG: hypothetical protein WAO20_07950 [Acidobacteriota bacterium]
MDGRLSRCVLARTSLETIRFSLSRTAVFLITLWGLWCPGLSAGPIEMTPQVVSNIPVPGAPQGTVFYEIGDGVSNGNGDIVFVATYGPLDPAPDFEPQHGIFLKTSAGYQSIAVEGDPLGLGFRFHPSHSSDSGPDLPGLEFDINEAGTVALILADEGVVLYEDGAFHWLVWVGYLAPGTTAGFDRFGRLSALGPYDRARPFLNGQDEVAFRAVLSDDTGGVFLAAPGGVLKLARSGEAVPDRSPELFGDRFSSPLLEGTSTWFMASSSDGQVESIHLYAGSDPVFSTQTGDVLPGMDSAVTEIGDWSVNLNRQLAVAMGSDSARYVVLLDPESAGVIARNDETLPNYGGAEPFGFSNVGINDEGAVSFIAHGFRDYAALYLWQDETLARIVADGDPQPGGGVLELGREPFGGPPTGRLFRTTGLANGPALGFDAGMGFYLWREGELEPLPGAGPAPFMPGVWADGFRPLSFDSGGRLLLRAYLCCYNVGSALYRTVPPSPDVSFLPLFAVGSADGLRYASTLMLANQSSYPGTAQVSFFDRNGQLLEGDLRTLEGGEVVSLELSSDLAPEPMTGYAEIRVLGGARISGEGTVSLFDSSGILSRTTVPVQAPSLSTTIPAEIGSDANTGVALANFLHLESALNLELELADPANGFLRSATLDLPPEAQRSAFVSELFDDIPVPFLGTLTIRARNGPFLAAGLRMSRSKLSTLPLQPTVAVSENWSFEQLGSDDGVDRVVPGPGGTVALLPRGNYAVQLIEGDYGSTLLRPPPAVGSGSSPTGLQILGFLANGELIVGSGSEEDAAVYRLREGALEPLVRTGDPLPEGGHFSGRALVNRDGILLIEAVEEGRSYFYLYDGEQPRLWFQSDSIIEAVQLDFRSDFGIAFRTFESVGRIDPSGTISMIAAAYDTVRPGFRMRIFHWVQMLSDGRVVFMANDASQTRSALCVSNAGGFEPLVTTDDAVPGVSARVSQFYAETPVGTIRVNAADRIMLKAYLSVSADPHSILSFLSIDPSGTVQLVLPRPDRFPTDDAFVEISNGGFVWGDEGELYFRATTRERPPDDAQNLFLWQDGHLARIVGQGDHIFPEGAPGAGIVKYLNEPVAGGNGTVYVGIRPVGDASRGLYRVASGDQSREWVPWVAAGDFGNTHYTSTLLIHNPGMVPVAADLQLHGPGLADPGHILELEPGEVIRRDYDSSEVFLGWASLESLGGGLQVYERLALKIGGMLRSEVTIPAVRPLRKGYWIGEVDPESAIDSGLAVVNTGRTPAYVSVELLTAGLEVQATASMDLPGGGSGAVLLSEFFPVLPPGKHLIRIKSEVPVSAISLHLQGTDITSAAIFGVNRFLGVGAAGVIGAGGDQGATRMGISSVFIWNPEFSGAGSIR